MYLSFSLSIYIYVYIYVYIYIYTISDQYHSGQDGDFCMSALHFDCSDSDWLKSGIKCVDRELMCNGHLDCTNGADEHLDSCGKTLY